MIVWIHTDNNKKNIKLIECTSPKATSTAAVMLDSPSPEVDPETPDLIDEYSDLIERKSPMMNVLPNITKSNKKKKRHKSSSSISTSNSQNKQRMYQFIALLSDQRFWSRIITFFVTIFLWLLSVLYTHAQVLQLKLSNYWCPIRTIDEIHQNSVRNNLPFGTEDNCWISKEFSVTNYYCDTQ